MIATTHCESSTPFPGRTGRGIRVAVIDSGANTAHPHICAPTRTVLLDRPAKGEYGAAAARVEDTLGHGTAVAAAIQEKAPEAEYFAVKLFDTSLRATTHRLLEAIEWTIEHRMDVVNLSVGTPNTDAWAKFQALIHRASAAGAVFVSVRRSGLLPLLPGALPEVIGVDVDWDLPRHRYRAAQADGRWYFFASANARPHSGVPGGKNLSGISFAAANMTGFVARACEALKERSVHAVREALAAEAEGLRGGAPRMRPDRSMKFAGILSTGVQGENCKTA